MMLVAQIVHSGRRQTYMMDQPSVQVSGSCTEYTHWNTCTELFISIFMCGTIKSIHYIKPLHQISTSALNML